MAPRKKPAPLLNVSATSAPRSGEIGILPVEELADAENITRLRIVVTCPFCSSYADVIGDGESYRNITQMVDPTFSCSQCSWRPKNSTESPDKWKVFYSGRLGGTLIWAMNEDHLSILAAYLETSPRRRKRVSFGWEYRHLMQRLPVEAVSGRSRNDMVSLVKKLIRTRPQGL